MEKPRITNDTPINMRDLEEVLQENHRIVGDRISGYMVNSFSLMERFVTKRSLAELVTNSILQEAQTEIEFRHNLLKMMSDFKMEVIREKYDNWLKVIKVEYRQKFTAFVTERQEELRRTIHEKMNNFLDDMEKQYERAERISHIPSLHSQVVNQLKKESNDYIVWLDKLMTNFMDIVEEKINQYK